MEKKFLPAHATREIFSELSITALARFSAIRGSLTCMVQAPFSLGTFLVIRGQPFFLSHVLATMSSGRRPTTRARGDPQAGEDATASLGPPNSTRSVPEQQWRHFGIRFDNRERTPPVVHRRHLWPAIRDRRDQISCISSCRSYGFFNRHSRPAEEKEDRRSSCINTSAEKA